MQNSVKKIVYIVENPKAKCYKNEVKVKILKGKCVNHGDPYQSNKSFKMYFGFTIIVIEKTEKKRCEGITLTTIEAIGIGQGIKA